MYVLVDIRVSMPMMSIIMMQKLGIMHLVIGLESLVTHVMGSIKNFLVQVGLRNAIWHSWFNTYKWLPCNDGVWLVAQNGSRWCKLLINSNPEQTRCRCLSSSFKFVINVMGFLDVGNSAIVKFSTIESRNEENGEWEGLPKGSN